MKNWKFKNNLDKLKELSGELIRSIEQGDFYELTWFQRWNKVRKVKQLYNRMISTADGAELKRFLTGTALLLTTSTWFAGCDSNEFASLFTSIPEQAEAVNTLPVADAGDDITQQSNIPFNYDGSESSDAEGIESYNWTFIGRNTETVETAEDETGTITLSEDVYDVTLVITDTAGVTARDTAVYEATAVPNTAPTADAGSDLTQQVGTEFAYDASLSSDSDGTIASYEWTFTGRTTGSTINKTGETGTVALNSVEDWDAVLVVTDDSGAQGTDSAVYTAENILPTADAGNDLTQEVGTSFHYDGSGSSDTYGTISEYNWSFTGEDSTEYTRTGVSGDITLDKVQTWTVELTVEDNSGGTDTDTATFVATIPSTINPNFTSHSGNPDPFNLTPVTEGVIGHGIGDIDSDGDLDVVITGDPYIDGDDGFFLQTNESTDSVTQFDSQIQSPYHTTPSGQNPVTSIAFADMDSDGDIDMFNVESGTVWLTFFNENDSEFKALERVAIYSPSVHSVCPVDIDNDGDYDLLLGMDNGNVLFLENTASTTPYDFAGFPVQLNDNTGTPINVGNYGSDRHYAGVAAADIDDDGDLDLILTGRSGDSTSNIYVCINNGNSSVYNFNPPELSLYGLSTVDVAWANVTAGDLDGDYDIDILISGHNYQGNSSDFYFFENTDIDN